MEVIPILAGIVTILRVVNEVFDMSMAHLVLLVSSIWITLVHSSNVENRRYTVIRSSNTGINQNNNGRGNILISISKLPYQWVRFIGISIEFFLTITILASVDEGTFYKQPCASPLPTLVCLFIQFLVFWVLCSIHGIAYERDCIEQRKKPNHIKRNILNVYSIAVIIITLFLNIATLVTTWSFNYTTSSYIDSMVLALGAVVPNIIIAIAGLPVIIFTIDVIIYVNRKRKY